MLYLEDFVEMIEHLPQELRDRFTEMREMDLGVQNAMDRQEEKAEKLFANAKKMKQPDRDTEYESIRQEYYKILDDADEKVHLAEQMKDLVERYLRRLDQETHKFKMELEADNKGITEILEKRSLELDQPQTNSSQKENRYSFSSSRSRDNHSHSRSEKRRDSNASSTSIEKRAPPEKVVAPSSSLPEPNRPTTVNSGPLSVPPSPLPATTPSSGSSSGGGGGGGGGGGCALGNSVGPVGYNLGHIGPGGNAIAAAASQAIAATQHMQQGRRTASLRASYDAINMQSGVHGAEFSRELAGAAQTAIAAIQESSKKHKKKVTSSSVPNSSVVPSSVQQQQQQQQQQHQSLQTQQQQPQHQAPSHQVQQQQQQQQSAQAAAQAAAAAAAAAQAVAGAMNSSSHVAAVAAGGQANLVADAENPDWTYDPNEPRYCVCNQVSYGDMVACDNSDCPFEWFHYPCVNITAPPKGKWYCPQCTSSMKRRGNRKN